MLSHLSNFLANFLPNWLATWLSGFDRAILWLLPPLAWAIFLSGLDDLVVDLFWAFAWLKANCAPPPACIHRGSANWSPRPCGGIAILVPLWHEHAVIAAMLEHNFASIRYSDYHIFAGCYPNDSLTQEAVRAVTERFPNVHMALCPHDGPTSKADCLNWASSISCSKKKLAGNVSKSSFTTTPRI